jgi:ABC-type nitrate/sulfonate/bicarbonate transport system permease component
VLVLLVAWEIVARVTNAQLVIVPLETVAAALGKDIASGDFLKNSGVTLSELAVAFPLSVLLGIALGAVLAGSRQLQQATEPILTAMNAVPMVALAPLFISWLGLGLTSKIAIVVLVSIFSVIINTEVGLRATDPDYIEAARSFNARPLQVFTTVTLPFAVPFIVGGIRVAFARALVGVVVAEFFGATAGYGYAILAAGQTFDTGRLLGYVLVLAVVGMLGSVLLRFAERRLAPWRDN